METTVEKKRTKKGYRELPNLRTVRESRDLSIRELAALSGVATSTIVRLQRGGQFAQPRVRRALAKSLGVGVKDLTRQPEEVNVQR